MKLLLVVEPSAEYRDYVIRSTLEDWGCNDVQEIDSLDTSAKPDLFGETPVALLKFEKDLKNFKKAQQQFQKWGGEDVEKKYPSGLIICTDAGRVSTKQIEKKVKDFGGILSLHPSGKEMSLNERLLSEINVSRAVKDCMLQYVGEDFESLIPLVKSISKISKQNQRKITEADILVRLSQDKGAVKPWAIHNSIKSGNVSEALEVTRRICQHQHPLVLVAILRNQYQGLYLSLIHI